jgi:predicted nucleic acid-binding protein
MIVVADTSPLNYLVQLGKDQILQEIYHRVVVPTAVLLELQHTQAPAEVRTWALSLPHWVDVVQPITIDASLANELGPGERQAISIALEMNADLLLIDERSGRRAAEQRNLKVAGTLAVLLRAGLLDLLDFPLVLQETQRLGFRVSPELEATMLAIYRQRKGI